MLLKYLLTTNSATVTPTEDNQKQRKQVENQLYVGELCRE